MNGPYASTDVLKKDTAVTTFLNDTDGEEDWGDMRRNFG
jgi:hypothetical protein